MHLEHRPRGGDSDLDRLLPRRGSDPGSRGSRPWVSYAWVVLFLTTLAQSSVSVLSQSMAPIAPFVQQAFDLSRSQLALLNIAMASGTYFTLILSGRLLDRVGE